MVPWGAIINAGSQLGGSYMQSRTAGKKAEASITQAQDQNAIEGYKADKQGDMEALVKEYQSALDRAAGEMEQYKLGLAAPGQRAGNAVRGDILANVQDANISAPAGVHMPTMSGGLRPSMLSGDTRALGSAMTREALLDQMSGSPKPFSSLPNLDLSSITSRKAPITELPQESAMDKIMAAIGTYAPIAGAATTIARGNQPVADPYTEYHGTDAIPSVPLGTGAPSVAGQFAKQPTKAGQVANALPPGFQIWNG